MSKYRTYIVLGNMRGGTSMVAGTLRILGVNMGDNIDEENHEDLDLQHRHPLHLRDLIEEKNGKHNVWGWKDPMLIDCIDDMVWLCPLRHPLFIIIFRDIYATALRMVKEEGWLMRDCLDRLADQDMKLVSFMNSGHPTVGFSYEKAIADPRTFIESLLKVTDLEADEETIERAVDFIRPGYRTIES